MIITINISKHHKQTVIFRAPKAISTQNVPNRGDKAMGSWISQPRLPQCLAAGFPGSVLSNKHSGPDDVNDISRAPGHTKPALPAIRLAGAIGKPCSDTSLHHTNTCLNPVTPSTGSEGHRIHTVSHTSDHVGPSLMSGPIRRSLTYLLTCTGPITVASWG